MNSYTVEVRQDSIYDQCYIELPHSLLSKLSWKEHDKIEFINNTDGTFTLKKVNE